MKNVEYWIFLQLGLDVGLFILVVFFIFKIRSLGWLLQAPHPGGGNHAGKLASLSQRVGELEQRLREALNPSADLTPNPEDSGGPGFRPAFIPPDIDRGKSLRAQVEELATQGLSPEGIARRLGLQLAEVKVALDLSRILAK